MPTSISGSLEKHLTTPPGSVIWIISDQSQSPLFLIVWLPTLNVKTPSLSGSVAPEPVIVFRLLPKATAPWSFRAE